MGGGGFGHALEACNFLYLPVSGAVGAVGGGKASRKNTFGISLTPPRGRRIQFEVSGTEIKQPRIVMRSKIPIALVPIPAIVPGRGDTPADAKAV